MECGKDGLKESGRDSELDRLAEDWIGLWQSELAALAGDPEMAALWRQGMAQGAAMVAAWAQALAAWPKLDERPAPSPGPAPAAAASGAGGDAGLGGAGGDLAALRSRIDELERRLAALEGGAAGGGADRRRPRRRRPPA